MVNDFNEDLIHSTQSGAERTNCGRRDPKSSICGAEEHIPVYSRKISPTVEKRRESRE